MIRLRINYAKMDALRYIGHLDLQKVWIRVLLRSKVPIAYTQGFHPSPKFGTGWPLPLGWEGKNELIDIWLDLPEEEFIDNDSTWLINKLEKNSPPGLRVKDGEIVPLYSPSLTVIIQSARYLIRKPETVSMKLFNERREQFESSSEVLVTRRDKTFDIKPMVNNWAYLPHEDMGGGIEVEMPARESAMGRPDELISALGFDPLEWKIIRERFLFDKSAEEQADSVVK